MNGLLSRGGVLLMLIACSGCQTTGDPTQGGLFGWSETKAISRQSELRNQLLASQNTNAQTSSRSRSLGRTVSTLNADIDAKSAQLARLRSEISALRGQIEGGEISSEAAKARAASLQKQINQLPVGETQAVNHDLEEIVERIKLLNN